MATYAVTAAITTASDGPPPVDLVSGANTDVTIAYALNIEAEITKVVFNWAAASKSNCINITEWSGLVAASAIDVTKHGGGGVAVSPQVATTLTTLNANDLVVYAIQSATTNTLLLASCSPTTGWTALTGGAEGGSHMSAAYQAFTSTGTYGAAWTMGVAAVAGMVGASFKASGTPALVNQTEQDNASGHSNDTLTIPATTAGNALVIVIGQAAASTAVNVSAITDNAFAPMLPPAHVPFMR